jgi:hypothetical protein
MLGMVTEASNRDEHLLPARHTKGDLFICDVADAVLKDIMPQMEHPFYSLSKKPETKIRRYEHNGNWLEIIPSVKGLAKASPRIQPCETPSPFPLRQMSTSSFWNGAFLIITPPSLPAQQVCNHAPDVLN